MSVFLSQFFFLNLPFEYLSIYLSIPMYVCLSFYLSSSFYISHLSIYPIYPTPRLGQDMTQGQFLAEFNRFEFRVFLLLD